MNLHRYTFNTTSDYLSFEFISEGPKGKIRKIIQFNKLIIPKSQNDVYNLAFGDHNEKTNSIDDLVVSNNKDSEMILATVAAAVLLFTERYADSLIFIRGSTSSRTRLYIMGVSKYYNAINNLFDIWGSLDEGKWEPFCENKPYKALLAKHK